MTDYLRPIAAYVASQGGHHNQANDHPGQPSKVRPSTPDTQADTTGAVTEAYKERTS